MIRVVLADDQALGACRVPVASRPGTTSNVVGEAADGHEAVALAKQHRPDVVLMDIRCQVSTVSTPPARLLPIPTSPRSAS